MSNASERLRIEEAICEAEIQDLLLKERIESLQQLIKSSRNLVFSTQRKADEEWTRQKAMETTLLGLFGERQLTMLKLKQLRLQRSKFELDMLGQTQKRGSRRAWKVLQGGRFG